MCQLFSHICEPNYRVLDIGANIGCTSLLFGTIAEKVTSFEPSPSTFSFLQQNIEESGLDTISVKNLGLGAADECLTLTFAPSNRSGGFVSKHAPIREGYNTEDVQIRRGDSIVGNARVDMMKIDVEGFEKHVIEGLSETIRKNHPVVVLELNHWCLSAFQRITVPDFFDFLLDVFPIVYAVDRNSILDLRNEGERYTAMYNHIMHQEYANLVAAFHPGQLQRFYAASQHNADSWAQRHRKTLYRLKRAFRHAIS